MSQKLDTSPAVIGIDIGKNSFHIVGQNRRGAIVLRQKWSRSQVEARLANLPPCLIGLEACVGAHHLSRKLQALGHQARLMPAKYVRPYSKGQKNDYRDAEAIAEAVQRPTMKFVVTKTTDQLDLQALHRVRERFVGQRTDEHEAHRRDTAAQTASNLAQLKHETLHLRMAQDATEIGSLRAGVANSEIGVDSLRATTGEIRQQIERIEAARNATGAIAKSHKHQGPNKRVAQRRRSEDGLRLGEDTIARSALHAPR
jgi:transposase